MNVSSVANTALSTNPEVAPAISRVRSMARRTARAHDAATLHPFTMVPAHPSGQRAAGRTRSRVLAVGLRPGPTRSTTRSSPRATRAHLARGHGYALNARQPSDGVTGPLWLLPQLARAPARRRSDRDRQGDRPGVRGCSPRGSRCADCGRARGGARGRARRGAAARAVAVAGHLGASRGSRPASRRCS